MSLQKTLLLLPFLLGLNICYSYAQKAEDNAIVQIVYTSDAHYGIKRSNFRGDHDVSGNLVNAAMISKINTLSKLYFPADSGVKNSQPIAYIDYLIESGDITNRMEIPVQSSALSWSQFKTDYMQGLKLKNQHNMPTQLLLLPGNHDISNAIGHGKLMKPLTDPTAMVGIYNLMLKPDLPKTNASYNYATDKVHYSFDVKGIHLMFVNLWPDSAERIWMQKDLQNISATTPVIIFTHDQPTCEAKHFTNPHSPQHVKPGSKFENLTAEHYKGDVSDKAKDGSTDIEQLGWVTFLKQHPNIKAYFHGNSNWNEYYVYKGPENNVNLDVFRVDSPMKGRDSASNETLLSFQLIAIDTQNQLLTVRECLWNTEPLNPSKHIVFGKSKTISLMVTE
ncbi:MAG: metallophosphoesterase [Candidatus Pedobacter colombiensis]|uniref:Metallophosphoesterase n=1 Tax=Candidatus Pedobacter colombiensis TaxID=3121371 RepID=A0AAJ5W8Z5_9SPHI|nr:metallophosphoesterase [Pedobacter sp.]WEK19423.1 MAG: metallophosphoesterase [Pedobacter sp.]